MSTGPEDMPSAYPEEVDTEGPCEDIIDPSDDPTEAECAMPNPTAEYETFRNPKDEIINDLQRLPEEILAKTQELYLKRRENDELSLLMKQIESSTMLEVDSALDDNGKKKFSNAEKRQAESESRLKSHSNYQNYAGNSDALKKQIDELSMKLEFVSNKFKAARAMALIIGD